MWDRRKENPCMRKKFDSLWLGPYKVERKYVIRSFYLAKLNGDKLPLSINVPLLNFTMQEEINSSISLE